MTAATFSKKKLTTMAFREWTTQELEEKFKLKRIRDCKSLAAWLDVGDIKIPEDTKLALEKLRDKLDIYAPHWNEDELIWYFVSRFFGLIDLESPYYQLFVNRSIQSKVGNYLMKGRVDAIVASGKYDPKAPFYCFHEYKKEKGSADDPIGQLLSAMLVGRKLNKKDSPIYGTYIVGRFWFFVVLEKDHYCISHGHIASNDDIFDIYKIVSKLKPMIDKQLGLIED